MKQKKVLTAEEIYKKNKKKAKVFSILAPIVYYFCLIVFVIFFIVAVHNSLGNVTEIICALDKDVYNETEIQENYRALVEQWGEWEIIGADKGGISVRYIDIRHALFSGLAITFCILSCIFLLCAIIFGKLLFPGLSKMYANTNRELVDMATLKSASQVDALAKKTKERGWF